MCEPMTSLNGSCTNGGVPVFIRYRMPRSMLHFFWMRPSDVLSGECISIWPLIRWSIKNSPMSMENEFVKKLMSFHAISAPSGLIQYWSDRLRPKDVLMISAIVETCSSCNRSCRCRREAGMLRPFHHCVKFSPSNVQSSL